MVLVAVSTASLSRLSAEQPILYQLPRVEKLELRRNDEQRCCRGRPPISAKRRLAVVVAATARPRATVDTASALASLQYTSVDGAWSVRPLNKDSMDEVRRVVALQTDAFHTAAPVPFLDGMSKRFFEAEVLSEMQKKLKYNPDDMFVSLVIEPTGDSGTMRSSQQGSNSSLPGVVGVVEVSYIAHPETLRALEPGTEGYCYIASMVVAPSWRRRGAAAALLAAAERAAAAWDERQALLHCYQDNDPGVQLYLKNGYSILQQDSRLWALAGARPRYLMQKRW